MQLVVRIQITAYRRFCIALFVSSVLFGFDGSIVRAFVFQLGGLRSFVLGGPTGPTGPTDVDALPYA